MEVGGGEMKQKLCHYAPKSFTCSPSAQQVEENGCPVNQQALGQTVYEPQMLVGDGVQRGVLAHEAAHDQSGHGTL